MHTEIVWSTVMQDTQHVAEDFPVRGLVRPVFVKAANAAHYPIPRFFLICLLCWNIRVGRSAIRETFFAILQDLLVHFNNPPGNGFRVQVTDMRPAIGSRPARQNFVDPRGEFRNPFTRASRRIAERAASDSLITLIPVNVSIKSRWNRSQPSI